MLARSISNIVRRILWALGFVRVRVIPKDASLTCGGTVPLTLILRPTPYNRMILNVELHSPSIVRMPLELSATPDSSRITAAVRGERIGRTEVSIRVVPTRRFGPAVQRFFSSLAAKFGFGFNNIKLTVGCPPILILAPHPDDEALMASGVIANALAKGEPVKVVIVTNGDHIKGKEEYGLRRQSESVAAMKVLGLEPADIIFLGYPGDGSGLLHIMNNYLTPSKSYTSIAGANATYGAHGLGNQDFHSWLTGQPAPYDATSLHADLEVLIRAFRPQHIYTTSRFDEHPEHRAVYYSLVRVAQSIRLEDPFYNPTLHTTIIHDVTRNSYEDFWESDRPPPSITMNLAGDDFWPIAMKDSKVNGSNSIAEITPPPNLWRTSLSWSNIERLPVPLSMQTSDLNNNLKYQVLQKYSSQLLRYLAPFCKRDEIFWQEDVTRNEILALSHLNLVLHEGETVVMAVSLVRPAPRTIAVAFESNEKNILIVPPAVVVNTGALTAVFAVKAARTGKASITASVGMPHELATVTVLDAAESLHESVRVKTGNLAR